MSTAITSDTKYTPNPDIITGKNKQNTLLYDPKNGEIITLNDTSAVLWTLILKKYTVKKMIDYLYKHYETERVIIEKDIRVLLSGWLNKKRIIQIQ